MRLFVMRLSSRMLFDLGFFAEINGNLIPQVPDLSALETEQSALETSQSAPQTTESVVETPESALHNPLSVDTFSEDVLSDDSCSEDVWSTPTAWERPAAAPASSDSASKEDSASSLLGNTATVLDEVREIPQSVVETEEDWADWTPPVEEAVTTGTTSADDW